MSRLKDKLTQLKQKNLFRERRVRTGKSGRYISVDGRQYINFTSNDYLGLSDHPEILRAAQQAGERFGYGSTGSAFMSGFTSVHQELEYLVAEFTGQERALVFSSGYLANLAVPQSLLSRQDLIIQDKLNHASLVDAAALSRATLKRYGHGNREQLVRLLKAHPKQNKLICTDGVFSMDGDQADLRFMSRMAAKTASMLWVDDAHGIGVRGPTGRGSLEEFELAPEAVFLLSGTFGKAFGTCGAFIAGRHDAIEVLLQRARSYRYNTALPVPDAAAALQAMIVAQQESWRRDKLNQLVLYFKSRMIRAGLPDNGSQSAIQPLLCGSEEKALKLSQALAAQGIFTTAIRPPTVPSNSSRLRITLTSKHETEDIDRLIKVLHSAHR